MASSSKKEAQQRFRTEYSMEWPFITKSQREYYVHCKICGVNFSIKHSGKYDITKHMSTPKHVNNCKAMENQKSKVQENNVKTTPEAQKVIEAECLMTNFFIEHNVPGCPNYFKGIWE